MPWVWPAGLDGPNAYAWFARDVEVAGPVRRAWLALSADTSYRLYVNGRFVLMGPMREVPAFFHYDAIDLAPLLRPGPNRLVLLVHYQGVKSQAYAPGQAGLILTGRVETEADTLDLTPPAGWRCRAATAWARDAHRLNGCLGFAEVLDLGVGESAFAGGDWPGEPPAVVAVHPDTARREPLPRDYPFFAGETFAPVRIERRDDGTLLDFGQEVFGFVELTVEAPAATTFHVGYAEQLTQGQVDWAKGGPRVQYRDRLSVPAGRHGWSSYEKRAMRFAWVDDPAVAVAAAAIHEYGYPYRDAWTPPPGDTPEAATARRILEVSARTIRLCSDDLLNDCPWRERAQYLDPYAYFGAMQGLFGTLEPVRKFLRQFARGARATGLLPMCYPSAPGTGVIPDFILTYALALRRYLQLSGDRDTVADCYAPARGAVDRLAQHADAKGLLTRVPGWVYLDNSFELIRTPRSSGLNALYAAAHAALADLAGALNRPGEAVELRRHYGALRTAWRGRFLHGGEVFDSDAVGTFRGREYWNYHYPADQLSWAGGSFVLSGPVRFARPGPQRLWLSFFNGCRAWLDGQPILESASGGGWTRPPLFHPQPVEATATGDWQTLTLEVQHASADWEVYLAAEAGLQTGPARVAVREAFGQYDPARDEHLPWQPTHWRPYAVPARSQVSAGLATISGMLSLDEARPLLTRCLPEAHWANFRKRTTPFFVQLTDDRGRLADNVLPCNTPWSLHFFCQALRQVGLGRAARDRVLAIFGQELDLGATSWWEEFGDASSLCHAWGAFAAEVLLET